MHACGQTSVLAGGASGRAYVHALAVTSVLDSWLERRKTVKRSDVFRVRNLLNDKRQVEVHLVQRVQVQKLPVALLSAELHQCCSRAREAGGRQRDHERTTRRVSIIVSNEW